MVARFGIAYTPEEPRGGLWGMSRRSVFVIDQQRVVRYAWVTDDALIEPDLEAVLAAVQAVNGA